MEQTKRLKVEGDGYLTSDVIEDLGNNSLGTTITQTDFHKIDRDELNLKFNYYRGIKYLVNRLKSKNNRIYITYDEMNEIVSSFINGTNYNIAPMKVKTWLNLMSNTSFDQSPVDSVLQYIGQNMLQKNDANNQVLMGNSFKYTPNPGYNSKRGRPPEYVKSEFVNDFYNKSEVAQQNQVTGYNKRARWQDVNNYYGNASGNEGRLSKAMNNYFTLGRTDHGLAFARAYINPADSEITKFAPCPDGSVVFSNVERVSLTISIPPEFNRNYPISVISSTFYGISCILLGKIEGKITAVAIRDTFFSATRSSTNIHRIRQINGSCTIHSTANEQNVSGNIRATFIPMVGFPSTQFTVLSDQGIQTDVVSCPYASEPNTQLSEKFYYDKSAKEGIYCIRKDIDGTFEFAKNFSKFESYKKPVFLYDYYNPMNTDLTNALGIPTPVMIMQNNVLVQFEYNPDFITDFTCFTITLPYTNDLDYNIKNIATYEYISSNVDVIKGAQQMLCPDSRAIEAALYIGSQLPVFLPGNANSWNSIWNGIKDFVKKEPIQSLISVGSKFLPGWGKVAVEAANNLITGKPYIKEQFNENKTGGGYDSSMQQGYNYQ